MKVIVGMDLDSGFSVACLCQSKGRSDRDAVTAISSWIMLFGRPEVVLQSDGEPPIPTVMDEVRSELIPNLTKVNVRRSSTLSRRVPALQNPRSGS